MGQTFDLILKSETDGICASKILCIVLIDRLSGTEWLFADQPGHRPLKMAYEAIAGADRIISHSGYHRKVLRGLAGIEIPDDRFDDTLEMAKKLFNAPTNKLGDWARRLGQTATPYQGRGADVWTPAMMKHCLEDAWTVAALYKHILRTLEQTP
jgi:hypothetical protein